MCVCGADGASWHTAAGEGWGGVLVVLGDRVQWRGGSSGQTDTWFIVSSFGMSIDKGNVLGMGRGGIGLTGNPLGACCHRGAQGHGGRQQGQPQL